jgi:hypothetical protein
MDQLSRFFTPRSPALETEEEARNREAKKAEFMDYFKGPVLTFADTAVKYLAGLKGGYEAFKTGHEYTPQPAGQAWKEFSVYLERLILIADTNEGKDIAARPQVAALVFGYGVLTLLRSVLGKDSSGEEAARLADHWQLLRKLRECWEKLGISADESRRVAALARMVLARTSPVDPALYTRITAGGIKADELAAALVLENYDADDFRRALAVNRFEDITWFNKEAFEETISRSSLFLFPEAAIAFGDDGEDSTEKWKKRTGLISAAAQSFLKAEKASGYRLEELPGVLAGTKKAAPKKTAGTAKNSTAKSKVIKKDDTPRKTAPKKR